MSTPPTASRYISEKFLNLPADRDLAIVFPGQGSQKVGMAQDICATSALARDVFELADRTLGMPLTALTIHGPDDELTLTTNAQPAILAASLALLVAAVESGAITGRPALVAGHSLGEYTALVAAGAMTAETAFGLVRQRGVLMERASAQNPGTMAAVVGLQISAVQDICQRSGAEVANHNGATQIVIGGTPEAVQHACAVARDEGGKGLPINVSGAFHTSLMKPAEAEFGAAVDSAAIADAEIPVVSNVTAKSLEQRGAIARDLKEQITSPVLWHQSVEQMVAAGVSRFVEVGPGNILAAMLKRTAPGVAISSLNSASAISGRPASTSNV